MTVITITGTANLCGDYADPKKAATEIYSLLAKFCNNIDIEVRGEEKVVTEVGYRATSRGVYRA